ncbi:tyrosine-type recombinase/integrase [Tateyamaria sp. Alg231-49]|uniref:tyrosine-type recombinase/integrase n=1 Tax=Tateyamaria sp. Alg231-49 TaxID=1922219 RepID=UPI000D55B7F2|nr:tyrosine-type recombinase/integrase [Tateyamaria sp. Alg231-49]
MPKRAKELNSADIRHLKTPDKKIVVPVGGVDGLYLQMTPTGGRSWLLRIVINGQRTSLGLGSFPTVSLSQARERARHYREEVWHGRDPRAPQIAMTFEEAAEGFLKVKLAEFHNDKHRAQWRATLDNYATPVIGDRPVADIDVQDVLRVLSAIWTTKTETASRLRGRIEAVLAWATVHGHRSGDNPARWKGNLDATLPKPSKVSSVRHHAAVPVALLPAFVAQIRAKDTVSARAIEFMTLTAARSAEVRGARWDEIDFDNRIWTIPAARIKTRKEHRVPLSDEAMAVLENMPRLGDLIFTVTGNMLSDVACAKPMKATGIVDARSGRPIVPHGLRSAFRDWAAETGQDRDMAEIALAHNVGSAVERAYMRSDMLERRRDMMQKYSDFLANES